MLFKLALRNLFRQKIRTGMTLSAIMFGVSGLIVSGGFVQDIFTQLGEAIIHSQTGHVQVVRKDFIERGTRQPERYLIDEPEHLIRQIESLPEVKEVTARLSFSGLLNNGRRDLAIIGEGVEPDKEARLGTFVTFSDGRHLSDSDAFGMAVGQGVAHSLGIKPGDRVTLVANTPDGALNTLDFELVGVFQSFSKDFDARAIRIPLQAAQELMFTNGVNVLVTVLHQTRATDEAHARISGMIDHENLEVHNWRMLSDFYEKTIDLYERQFGILQLIILAMVLLSVANSVNMAVFERMREFGTMQALGNRKHDIFRLIVAENLLLGLIGATVGAIVGIVMALVISAIGISMPPPPNANVGYTATISLVPIKIASAFLIGFLATALAALFPAHKVSGTPVVDALRQGE